MERLVVGKPRFIACVRILPGKTIACIYDPETSSTPSKDTSYKEMAIKEIVDWLEFEASIREDQELTCIGVAISRSGLELEETAEQLRHHFKVPVQAIEDRWQATPFSRKDLVILLDKIDESLRGTEDFSTMVLALTRAVTLE